MKNIIYILVGFCLLVSCEDDFDIADQGFDLEALPESISFDGGGDGIDADDEGDEGDGVTLTVEAPNGTLEDILVTYTLSGTATFGTDYTIAGATASGGSVTIVHDPSDVVNFDSGDIEIELLNDGENGEEDETIIITLASATRGSDQIAVGRGGTEFGKSATVTVSDVAQELSFSTSSLSTVESNVSDTLEFLVQLSYPAISEINYDLNIEMDSTSLMEGADFVFDAMFGVPGMLQIAAGERSDTVRIILVDDGLITSTPNGTDSLRFRLSNVSSTSDVVMDKGALQINVLDDVKEYGFSMSADTVSIGNITTYNYTVSITDTLSGAPKAAFSDVVIAYSTNTGTAVAGDDFNDITGGSVTIPAGETSTDISIQVVRTNENPAPVLTVVLTGATTTDEEVVRVSTNNTLNLKIE